MHTLCGNTLLPPGGDGHMKLLANRTDLKKNTSWKKCCKFEHLRRWVMARVWYLGVEHRWTLGWIETLILIFSILTLLLNFSWCYFVIRLLRLKDTQNLVKRENGSASKNMFIIPTHYLIFLTPHDNHTHDTDASPSSAAQVKRDWTAATRPRRIRKDKAKRPLNNKWQCRLQARVLG